MSQESIVTLCTTPDRGVAEKIAKALVERRLAACVNILPGITSIYSWEGKVEQDDEVLMVIKSRGEAFERLSSAIVELHPYELPEVIAVPITQGLPGYLAWIDENVE